MSDWQTQMAGLVQTAPEDRTNPFNLGVSALLTPFRHFLQNALVILSSFDAFRMEAFKLITAYFSFRSEEHTSELQSLMRISYAVFCLKKKRRNSLTQYTLTSSPHDIKYPPSQLILT